MGKSNFFRNSQNIFKLVRIWSYNPDDKKTQMDRFLKCLVFLCTTVSLTIIALSDVYAELQQTDPTEKFRKMLYLSAVLVSGHKLYTAAFRDEELYACIKRLEMLSKRFKNTSDIEKTLHLYDKISGTGLYFMCICTGFVLAAPLTTDVRNPLILTPHLPYLDHQKTTHWCLLYIFEVIALYIVTIVMISFDTLFCGMIYVCSGILSSLCREIREFDDIIEDHQRLDNRMKETIEKLIDITQLTTRISDIFSMTTMTHIIYNCNTMALGLFMMTILPINFSFMSMILVTVVVAFQLWIYCYFGQNLVSQRELLRTELYFTRWYDASKNFKTMLLLTIFETENDGYVYAGKIVPLSLDTFTEVVKRAYAFFTFLNESR